jgi:methyl-accepting chemotaxis protein-1 (serine sensor receptor)
MFANFTLKARLTLMLGFLSVLIAGASVIGIHGMSKINDSLRTVYEDRTVCLEQLSEIRLRLERNRTVLLSAITYRTADRVTAALADMDKNLAITTKTWDEYMATFLTPDEKKLADKFAADRKATIADGLNPTVAALKAGDFDGASKFFFGPYQSRFNETSDSLEALVQLQVDVAKQEYEAGQSLYSTLRMTAIAASIVGILFAIIAGWALVHSIMRRLQALKNVATGIAAGDLTQTVDSSSTDEIGQLMAAMGEMADKLRTVITQIRAASETVGTASQQIASGNLDLSQRTEEQASSLEETASSMEELTQTVKQNTENAKQANQLAIGASEIALRGGVAVGEVVGTMTSINEASKKIVDIISVIDGIAFQTNILALNAAVEAARAGEQGRGFAVVASEVRSLAQRSAAAAKEIKTLIGDTVDKVESGTKLVAHAGSTIDEVVQSVRRVTDIMAEITAASMEQSAGVEQVNQAIVQMDQVTQQNAALVEEAAAAAASMEEQARSLTTTVAVFRVKGAEALAAEVVEKASRPGPAPQAKAPSRSPVKAVPRAKAPAKAADGEWAEF